MNDLVRYNNDMNKIRFSNFKEKELDIFYSLILKMKYQKTKIVTLTFNEIRSLANYKYKGIQRFYDDLDRLYKKMLELNLKYENEKYIRRFVLFNYYEINKEEQVVKLSVNDQFEFILNNLLNNFTKFELEEFVNLKSIYSKSLFRLLKQWQITRKKELSIIEFKYLLSIPEKYRITNIDQKVLKPIMEELPQYFPNLKIEKIKTGRKITSIKFSWTEKEKNKKEKLPLINYIETQEKENPVIIANKCREIHGSDCTGGQQKEVICTLCNLMNKKNINKY